MTFSHLKSRWMMPARWAAPIAAAIARAIGTAAAGENGPCVAQALREADAGDQLHGDEQDARTGTLGAAVVNAEVEDAADVGVGDPARQVHLLFQAARGERDCRRSGPRRS